MCPFFSALQLQSAGESILEGGGMGTIGSHNGQSAASSILPSNKTAVSAQQLPSSASRGNYHGAAYGLQSCSLIFLAFKTFSILDY